ncbi:PREDICTED: LRR receptor-like serine/threonine-protein kinase GSO2 [Ipomoea nil]|uniref:LRR receptor-like serine/threonine-protein kinase GSO2 n=1 Tax=Ipomoea nil TaxID=35883 RepID=UPI000900FD74|nr:PREDICTED: LRR receptor-like serine/threonine-protein kinase GSO2 [Ipomoea nil]
MAVQNGGNGVQPSSSGDLLHHLYLPFSSVFSPSPARQQTTMYSRTEQIDGSSRCGWSASNIVSSSNSMLMLSTQKCVHSQWLALSQLRALNLHSPPPWEPSCDEDFSKKMMEWNMEEEDCCSWDGVTCDPATGYVIGLNLSFSMLSGEIFPIFNLHHLQTLNLACNNFNNYTPVPFPSSGFENLRYLTHLNLSRTRFSGQIPMGISRLTRLVSLDISWMFDYVELRKPNLESFVMNLTSLKEVYLDYVGLSAHGSKNWSQALSSALPHLEVLSLSNCNLFGPIHPSFATLKSLSYLQLSDNKLSPEIPTFFENFMNLETLNLASCELYGDFPENVFRLPKLKIIDISKNINLSVQFPEFPKHSSLQSISLSQTNFHGELPESIGNLRSLQILSLGDTNFHGELPESIGNLRSLKMLSLGDTNSHGELPESIGNLQSLKFLDFFHCKFSGLLPSSLANLTSIIEMDIEGNRFTGSLPPFHSTSVPNLSVLRMSSNLLTGEIHSSVFTLPSLKTLYLDGNKISGVLEEFSNTSSSVLEELYLNGNQFGGVLPKSIFKLPNLIHLSLASNNFNGSMKFEMLQNLKNLIDLDLSSNNLTVENDGRGYDLPQLQKLNLMKCNLFDFPIFLKSQVQLNDLNLSYTNIRGYVPSWLGNNSNLKDLDLSGNPIHFPEPSSAMGNNSFMSLSGLALHSCNISKFPKFLKGLKSLEYLDLSDNKMEGEFPSWIWENVFQFVNISHNLFSVLDEFPTNVSSILYALYLNDNRFKGSLPSELCNMSSYLDVLDASGNNLSGLIPECLLKDAPLTVLNLKGNRYHQMPSNFTLAGNLVTLNINGNRLKGKLPRSLVNCEMLQILDLGNNMISDSFPFWLEKLPSLKVLILRNNMFYELECNDYGWGIQITTQPHWAE